MVQAVLGPAAERLAMTFDGVDEYRAFWQHHPAFQGPWTPLMEDYIGYDLDPVAPEDPATAFRPSTRYEAMAQDTAELQGGGSLLAALEGLQVPTTLLWSGRSGPRGARAVHTGLPGAVEGTGPRSGRADESARGAGDQP